MRTILCNKYRRHINGEFAAKTPMRSEPGKCQPLHTKRFDVIDCFKGMAKSQRTSSLHFYTMKNSVFPE